MRVKQIMFGFGGNL